MPNITFNTIKMDGICNEPLFSKEDRRQFDFNKLCRMPESLDITNGGVTPLAIVWHFTKGGTIEPENIKEKEVCKKMLTDVCLVETDINRFFKNAKSYFDKAELDRLGKIYYDNFIKYGHCTWYEWCCENWGTKWNAFETQESKDGNEISFCTAWCMPLPVVEKLVEKYKKKKIEVEWEDEDGRTGTLVFKEGKCVYENIKESF